MGTRADLVAAISAALVDAAETAEVLDRPVAPIPAIPTIMVVPGGPYLENVGRGSYLIRLVVIVWAGRLDEESAMDVFDRLIPVVRSAAPEAELRYISTSVGVETSGGVDYVTARSSLEGETQTP